MQLKIEPYLGRAGGGDDTMLNAIRLTCTDEEVLVSAEGPWGVWHEYTESADHIVGLQLRSERSLGLRRTTKLRPNDTATNGVRFLDTVGRHYYPGDGLFGEWRDWVFCPAGTVVIGFRTQVEHDTAVQYHGDHTALNRAEFICGSYEP